jgi:hypothetical protein
MLRRCELGEFTDPTPAAAANGIHEPGLSVASEE